MIKRLFVSVALFIGLITLLGTNANAYPACACGGWGAEPCYFSCEPEAATLAYSSSTTKDKKSDPVIQAVCIWSKWVGVANSEKKPTRVEVSLEILSGQLHYFNPSDKGGGLGNSFYPNIPAVVLDQLDEGANRNGRFESYICFLGSYLLSLIDKDDIPPPPNPKWELDNSVFVVLEAYVTLKGYSDLDGDSFAETETAHVNGYIELDKKRTRYISETLLNPDGSEQIWGWKQNDQECPYE
jgi:hypothetical protein